MKRLKVRWRCALLGLALISFCTSNLQAAEITADLVVTGDGSGDFTTIQGAVNAAPNNSSNYTVIYIKEGTYNEPVSISSSKKNIVLYGESNVGTIITYATEKTQDLATLTVNGEGFIAYNLSIVNTAGPTYGPAQAVRQEADKSVYLNCRIIGNQDTYRTGYMRSYSRNCYYEGTVDFIFGDGKVVFENCVLYSKGGSALTAASTKDYSDFGYVFKNCRVISKSGTTTHLGRPWREYAAVAFINTELPDEIVDAGWHNWGQPDREATSRFAEYNNYGPGATVESRVDWATMMTEVEASEYSTLNVLKSTYSSSPVTDNWNPYHVIEKANISGLLIEGDGYGMNEGGNGGTVVTVTTESDLRKYATSDQKYVVQISGMIKLNSRLDVGSNTTIVGLDENSGISGSSFHLSNENKNIIIKYLNITNPSGDGISVWNAQRVFISHVDFYDCGDGSCDINRGSDSVTLSYCRFYYPTQADHRFTMIADGHMTWDDNGVVIAYGNKLNLTLHHNWWDEKSDQRMPSASNTNAHMYNNYWSCTGNYYCSNARHETEFYSENNYYDGVKNPVYAGEADGKIFTKNNTYNNCTGTTSPGTDDVFIPTYAYDVTTTSYVPEVVKARAGNTGYLTEEKIEIYELTVGISDQSTGTGFVNPMGVSEYSSGSEVTLEATPALNSQFVGWVGDIESTENPLNLEIYSDQEVLAKFEKTLDVRDLNDSIIYPNPSKGTFKVKMGNDKEATVTIYNMAGVLLYQEDYTSKNGIINVSVDLGSGMYILNVSNSSKVMKQYLGIK